MSDAAIDVLVIGAGVTGLAAALEIASRGHSTAIAEQHPRPGMETSTHNSGVIHAGALLSGRDAQGAALRRRGEPPVSVLRRARRRRAIAAASWWSRSRTTRSPRSRRSPRLGTANGAEGLEVVGPAFIQQREPHVRALAALWSPNTGRVEAEGLVRTLQRLGEAAGAALLRQARVVGAERRADGIFAVRTERETIEARVVVNAAGLYADDVSAALGGEAFRIYACRGEYAELKRHRRDWLTAWCIRCPNNPGTGSAPT